MCLCVEKCVKVFLEIYLWQIWCGNSHIAAIHVGRYAQVSINGFISWKYCEKGREEEESPYGLHGMLAPPLPPKKEGKRTTSYNRSLWHSERPNQPSHQCCMSHEIRAHFLYFLPRCMQCFIFVKNCKHSISRKWYCLHSCTYFYEVVAV